jgi:hypothetical protein
MAVDANAAAYAAMVAEAEAAVAAVKDPELRRVAFEKILGTLLEQASEGADRSRGKRRARQPERSTPTKVEHPARKARKGPKAYIEELISDDFFKKPRTIAAVKAELANRGHHIPLTSLSGRLQSLTQERKLRRQKTAASSKGTKTTYAYSNW